MNKIILFLLLFFGTSFAHDPSHLVLVSVAPYKFFVEKIAGEHVQVHLMVPAGASSHTYEPTPRQMAKASGADIWFALGEPFEAKAVQALKSHYPDMQVVDMRQGIELLADGCQHCKHAGDPHIWLSPKLAKVQAMTIADTLMEVYPDQKKVFAARLKGFLEELDGLDREISATLARMPKKVILVSHPAYAYFCRDYGLKQLSIEFEGKDPTPKQLTRLLQDAKAAGVDTIFVQMQYSDKAAKLIAREIGAELVVLDPYSESYLNSMREIALRFAESSPL